MPADMRSLNENCGLFGIWGNADAANIAYYGLHSLQHRGENGAGIVVKSGDKLNRHRGLGLVSEVFSEPVLNKLVGTAAIGQVRCANEDREDKHDTSTVQPLLFHFAEHSLALCHNGNILNSATVRKSLEGKGSIFQTNTNSELLAHLMKSNGFPGDTGNTKNDFLASLKHALNQIKGSFAYLLLTQDAMIAALDPNGIKPLSVGRLGHSYIVSSETCAFDLVGAEFVKDVNPGEIIIIDNNGMTTTTFTDVAKRALCSFEFIYFARPDSDIHGVNVHTARRKLGEILATEAPADADIVIAIPEAGIPAAMGYSETSGIRYEMGIIKSRYVSRTFIKPSQSLREQGVKLKLSAVRSIVSGKRVAVVDDSIVRGTTTRQMVTMLRNAGAREVHLRISSPPFLFPDFYGVEIQDKKDLIGSNMSVEAMRKFLGADSLVFLSIDGVREAINLPTEDDDWGLCLASFNGEYPTELYDYQ